jgi:hypothetical protein
MDMDSPLRHLAEAQALLPARPNKNTHRGLRLRPSQRFHDLAAIAAALLRSMNFMLQPCCAVSD